MVERKLALVDFPDEERFEKTGIGVYGDGIRKVLDDAGVPYSRISAIAPDRRIIFRWFFGMFTDLISRARKTGPNDVTHIVYEGFGFLMPFIRGKRIVTIHHVVQNEEGDSKAWYLAWKFFTKLAIRYSDMIVAISAQTRKELIEVFRVPESKIRVVMNKPSNAFSTIEGIERKRSVGFVGTLTKRKNVPALMRLFKGLIEMPGMSDVSLRICGKGPESDALHALADSLGITDRTEFVEDISTDELNTFYNSVSVLANPSLHEGFGYVTLEAQRCSTPVVFFKHAEIPKEVTEAAVPCEDENEFRDTMYRLLTDEEYWSDVSRKGRTYSESFGNDYACKMLDIYFGPME